MPTKPRKRRSVRTDDVHAALVGAIRSGEFQVGDYLPSERALLPRFDVSRPTVRRALQRLHREGYVECHPGIGYRLIPHGTRNAVAGGSRLVGVLWDGTAAEGRRDGSIERLERELSRHGLGMLLGFTGRDLANENNRIAGYLEMGVAGMLVTPALTGEGESRLSGLILGGYPVVTIGEPSNWRLKPEAVELCSYVGVDNRAGVRLMVEHLWELGHRRMGYVRTAHIPNPTRRERAFRSFCEERAAPADEGWIFAIPRGDVAAAVSVLEPLFSGGSENNPTALVCHTFEEAVAAGEALGRMGLAVPEDVSVAAFLDEHRRIEVQRRSLTGPAYQWNGYYRQMADSLVSLMEGSASLQRTLIRPALVAGASAAAPAGKRSIAGKG